MQLALEEYNSRLNEFTESRVEWLIFLRVIFLNVTVIWCFY
jgi:hypothetical protein